MVSSVMSVSLLPESRSACVYISVSLQVSFSFTGTIGIVSWQCVVLIPAFVTGTCEEFPVTFTDSETETFWGSAPPLVTPDWPSTLVLPVEEAPPLATPTWPSTLVLPAGLCKRVIRPLTHHRQPFSNTMTSNYLCRDSQNTTCFASKRKYWLCEEFSEISDNAQMDVVVNRTNTEEHHCWDLTLMFLAWQQQQPM